ncbi:MAG: hypothetical protein HY703_08290 [Gemmatimonadetes bacterium]|nr:hypothetical protein [Gemmatimonadota bacterium]
MRIRSFGPPALGALTALAFLGATRLVPTPAANRSEAAAAAMVTITAKDFEYEMPDEVQAGAVTFRLVSEGQELHHVQILQLQQGKTLEDFGKAMAAAMSPGSSGPLFPAWVKLLGGPNVPPAGGSAEATAILRPGRYVVLCLIPSPDGELHVAKGMAKEITVVGRQQETQLPAADIAVMLNDHDFELSKALTAGRHTLRVRNYAAQPHELVLVKLEPGKTAEDFVAWGEKPEGPPPGMFLGGTSLLSKSTANNMVVDLSSGNYALLRFVPDVKDRKPHFAHGMVKSFTI